MIKQTNTGEFKPVTYLSGVPSHWGRAVTQLIMNNKNTSCQRRRPESGAPGGSGPHQRRTLDPRGLGVAVRARNREMGSAPHNGWGWRGGVMLPVMFWSVGFSKHYER